MIVLDTNIWHWWVNQIPGKLSIEIITLIEFSVYRELDGRLIGRQ
jgi:PIN domain nuclease of toxin-antitoxin system